LAATAGAAIATISCLQEGQTELMEVIDPLPRPVGTLRMIHVPQPMNNSGRMATWSSEASYRILQDIPATLMTGNTLVYHSHHGPQFRNSSFHWRSSDEFGYVGVIV
jgi:hypothetical protein